MKSANQGEPRTGKTRDPRNLDSRYGKIGISAVAAAARYQGEAKKPAKTPEKPADFDDRFSET